MVRSLQAGKQTLDVASFREQLTAWYEVHARVLPWRGIQDPYRTWVSEIMLQQTRVAAVIEHYREFLCRFPTVVALAKATEPEVLAAWSGLGYYRRARMMHKAAQHIAQELGGVMPETSAELRKLPGIGEYTCAAIASICHGESVAVVDGNVERVLLRIAGRPEDTTAAGRSLIRQQAAALIPPRRFTNDSNAAGNHNQAMMELGATICLPRGPLCLQCPVFNLCRTRGEHVTAKRGKAKSSPAAYLLQTRGTDEAQEVLLEQRPTTASLMAGMYELPPLLMDAVAGRTAVLALKHAITNTVYAVQVFAPEGERDATLRRAVPARRAMLHWMRVSHLGDLPLTGLTRKVLQRLTIMRKRAAVQS